MTRDDDLTGFERYDDSAWLAAVMAADTTGSLALLVGLLHHKLRGAGKFTVTLSRDECELLADLLARHDLKRKPGKQRTPAYKRTQSEIKLIIAADEYRTLRKRGRTPAAALEQATQGTDVSQDALTRHLGDRLGASRRR